MATSNFPLHPDDLGGMPSSNFPSKGVILHRVSAPGPISRIAPELLTEIFLYTQHDKRFKFDEKASRSRQLIVICHVCAHWRIVATHYSPLWTVIDLGVTHPALMEKFITNSKVAKLNLRLGLAVLTARAMMSQVMEALPRIQALAFYPEYDGIEDVLKISDCWIPGPPASSLESLKFRAIDVPDDFFTKTPFPALKHLTVKITYLDIKPLPWNQLVTLKLNLPMCTVPVQVLLDCVRNAHQLRDLELRHLFAQVPENEVVLARVPNPIRLDALRSLSIDGVPYNSILTFLNQVSIPADASVGAHPAYGKQPIEVCDLIIAATLECRKKPTSSWTMGTFSMHIYYPLKFKFETVPVNSITTSTHITFTKSELDCVEPMDLVVCILQRHNLSCLTNLDLTYTPWQDDHDEDEFDTSEFWECMAPFRSIEVIKARHLFAETFVLFIAVKMEKLKAEFVELRARKSSLNEDEYDENMANLGAWQSQPNFSGLKELSLDFRPVTPGYKTPEPSPLYGQSEAKFEFGSFCDGLAYQKSHGFGLEKLVLTSVAKDELAKELCLLERVVGQIEYL